MRILVVDDEAIARQRLCRILAGILPEASLAEAGSGMEALQALQAKPADIVLLDIRMPGMDGLETAARLSHMTPPPAVIFTTAYDKHALQAFAAHATGYLLKPVQAEQLRQAISQAAVLNQNQLSALQQQQAQPCLSGSCGRDLVMIPVRDVCYLLAGNKYLVAATSEQKITLEGTLTGIQQQFPQQFVRVHRNALAGIAHIKSLHREQSGRWLMHFHGREDTLVVSRRTVPQLKQRLRP